MAGTAISGKGREKDMDEARKECEVKEELYKKVEDCIMDGLYEVQEVVQKRQHILDEIKATGMSPESYWSKIAEDTGKDTKWRKSKKNSEFFDKLIASDKSPKEKLNAYLDHLISESVQEKREELIKRRTRCKFGNHWGAFNYQATVTLEKVAVKNGLAAAIFLYLARKSDTLNKATCSYKDMVKEFGVSQRSISRAISLLEENRLVTVYKTGLSNYYVVSNNVTWKTDSWKDIYCKFDGMVINKRNEQRKIRSEKAKERAAIKKASEEKVAEGEEGEKQKQVVN